LAKRENESSDDARFTVEDDAPLLKRVEAAENVRRVGEHNDVVRVDDQDDILIIRQAPRVLSHEVDLQPKPFRPPRLPSRTKYCDLEAKMLRR
jgi:hypothetical protein